MTSPEGPAPMSGNAGSLNKPSPSSQGSAPQVEKIIDALNLYVCAMDNAVQILKQALAKLEKKTQPSQTGLNEEAFNLLKWEVNKGSKLGNFEVTYKAQNPPDTWQHVFNVLKANGATIKAHFEPEGFSHYYWLWLPNYEDRVFRKKREGTQK